MSTFFVAREDDGLGGAGRVDHVGILVMATGSVGAGYGP